MAGLEDVVNGVKAEAIFANGVCANRSRLLESLEVAAAENFLVDHELIATHLGVGIVVGVLVDEFDDHVVVGARGRGEYVGHDFAGKNQVLLEDRKFEVSEVFAIGDEALIFGKPVEPLRAVSIRGLDGAMAIGNRVRWIADVVRLRRLFWFVPAQGSVAEEMDACGLRLFRREM